MTVFLVSKKQTEVLPVCDLRHRIFLHCFFESKMSFCPQFSIQIKFTGFDIGILIAHRKLHRRFYFLGFSKILSKASQTNSSTSLLTQPTLEREIPKGIPKDAPLRKALPNFEIVKHV
jgi:hypothetical protein